MRTLSLVARMTLQCLLEQVQATGTKSIHLFVSSVQSPLNLSIRHFLIVASMGADGSVDAWGLRRAAHLLHLKSTDQRMGESFPSSFADTAWAITESVYCSQKRI